MPFLFRSFRDFIFNDVCKTLADTLPKILSKSSIRHDLIESIEPFIKTSFLTELHPEESLIMDAMTEYISVRYYMHPVCLA